MSEAKEELMRDIIGKQMFFIIVGALCSIGAFLFAGAFTYTAVAKADLVKIMDERDLALVNAQKDLAAKLDGVLHAQIQIQNQLDELRRHNKRLVEIEEKRDVYYKKNMQEWKSDLAEWKHDLR